MQPAIKDQQQLLVQKSETTSRRRCYTQHAGVQLSESATTYVVPCSSHDFVMTGPGPSCLSDEAFVLREAKLGPPRVLSSQLGRKKNGLLPDDVARTSRVHHTFGRTARGWEGSTGARVQTGVGDTRAAPSTSVLWCRARGTCHSVSYSYVVPR